MANNTMWLVHDESGQRVAIARHHACQWNPYPGALESLAEAFQAEAGSGIGSTGWHVEYSSHSKEDDPLQQSTTTSWQDADGEWHTGNRPMENEYGT